MQVTNSATIVDYFPEAFVAEACDIKGVKVVIKRFISVSLSVLLVRNHTAQLLQSKQSMIGKRVLLRALRLLTSTPKKCLSLSICLASADMKQSFADYVATQQQRMDNLALVLKYSEMLCEALTQDFYKGGRKLDYKFYIESGRKYHKIIMECENGSRSVHAFVEKKFGAVYKPASWKAPAKHIRFTLLDDNSREECFARCDWAGGYLYM